MRAEPAAELSAPRRVSNPAALAAYDLDPLPESAGAVATRRPRAFGEAAGMQGLCQEGWLVGPDSDALVTGLDAVDEQNATG